MSKISELSEGNGIQTSDYLIAVRSGGNVKVRMDQIKVDGTTKASFTTNGLEFPDNSKAIFGAGSDLQIYSDGTTGQVTGNVNVTGSVTADGLTVESSSDPTSITLRHTGNTSGLVIKNFSGSESQLINVDNGPMVFKTNDTERLRIDAQGQVRLSNTTPVWDTTFSTLVSKGGFFGSQSTSYLYSGQNVYYNGGFKFSTAANATIYEQSFGAHTWYRSTDVSPAADAAITLEAAMTLDASGNLLVGTTNSNVTSTSGNNPGINIGVAGIKGFMAAARYQGPPLSINRLDNDGDIQLFSKDGTTVGSIGTQGGDLNIGTAACGIAFVDGVPAIYPWTTTGNTTRDAAIDLGDSGGRFKDLYLSGGVYFDDAGGSGTTSSNYLDAYEEGTWTPVIKDTSATGTTVAISAVACTYTKIGRIVTLVGSFTRNDTATLTGNLVITGLPFTATGGQQMGGNAWVDNTSADILCQISAGNTSTMFLKSVDAPNSYVTTDDWENGRLIYFTRTYQAS